MLENYAAYTEYDPLSICTVAADAITTEVSGNTRARWAGAYKEIEPLTKFSLVQDFQWDFTGATGSRPANVTLLGLHTAVPEGFEEELPDLSIYLAHNRHDFPQPVYLWSRSTGQRIPIVEPGIGRAETACVRLQYDHSLGKAVGECWTNYNAGLYDNYGRVEMPVPPQDYSVLYAARVYYLDSELGHLLCTWGSLDVPTELQSEVDFTGAADFDVSGGLTDGGVIVHYHTAAVAMSGDSSMTINGQKRTTPGNLKRATDIALQTGTNWM